MFGQVSMRKLKNLCRKFEFQKKVKTFRMLGLLEVCLVLKFRILKIIEMRAGRSGHPIVKNKEMWEVTEIQLR